jgi:hypothetical protein
VKNWGETSLEIDNAVASQVFRLFVSDTLEGFFGLHYGDGVGKAFQIFWEASLVGTLVEPVGELFGIFGGKSVIASGIGQVDDGFGTEDAVEVFVEQHLGEAFQQFVINVHRGPLVLSQGGEAKRGEG